MGDGAILAKMTNCDDFYIVTTICVQTHSQEKMKQDCYPLEPTTFVHRGRRGFALIVTLSLMILLTVIAVGLLTLSTISLRSSSQSNAMSSARANAKLALMMAIGDLQKNAGPDQRVSAKADIQGMEVKKPQITGIWHSWNIGVGAVPSDFDKKNRDSKFRGWLTSGNPLETTKIGFADEPPSSINSAADGKSSPGVILWGRNSLGALQPATSPPAFDPVVTANKVAVLTPPGAVAWAVMDEGVKVRINTQYVDEPLTKNAPKTLQLGSGKRPGVEFISGLDGLNREFYEKSLDRAAILAKGITRSNFALASGQIAAGLSTELKPLFHDVTPYSVGLFTDTAKGGMRQDFQLLSNAAALPTKYNGVGVYKSRGLEPSGGVPSDPKWDSFHQFARLYKTKVKDVAGVPVVKVSVPSGWAAGTAVSGSPVATVKPEPPTGTLLLPSIAKVQVLFSLVGRDIYDYPWDGRTYPPPPLPATYNNLHGPIDQALRGTKYHYDLHLLNTPIVSLYNPYNVAIEFNNMELKFLRVPFAMQVFRNGEPLSQRLVPFETMFWPNYDGKQDKVFSMQIKPKTGSSTAGNASTPIRLLPGEVRIFSPTITPTLTYNTEIRNWGGAEAWDANFAGNNRTTAISSIPGWRGKGLGFDVDQLVSGIGTAGGPAQGKWGSSIAFKRDDLIRVEFAPISAFPAGSPAGIKNKFRIQMSASVEDSASGSSATNAIVSIIDVDYENGSDEKGLQTSILGEGKVLKFPADGSDYPAIKLVDHSKTPYNQLKGVAPFALVSVQAKSTMGMKNGSPEDGRFGTKPWAFGHSVIGTSSQKIIQEHIANQSHEITIKEVDPTSPSIVPVDGLDRTVYFSGHQSDTGTKFGNLYDVPLAPIQTLAGLNGANPGGSSGYLPRFAQPIGNSWAHPGISPEKMWEAGPSGYNYVDHSFMLNSALYDSFYFSGLADQTGDFGAGKTSSVLAADYVAGKPLDDLRLRFNRPSDKQTADFASELTIPDAHEKVAAWQVMEGAFNINSTSVSAWKAMLASVHDSQSVMNGLASDSATATSISPLEAAQGGKVRISRSRLPGSKSSEGGGDPQNAYWLGSREYTDVQLQILAENIVKQVRLRGPFLSMGEFVNRRLGSESDPMAQRGALQQAIDDSDLNSKLAEAASAGYEIPSATISADKDAYKYKNKTAGEGASYQGAPGYLTQGDLMNVLGNAATARSDTFTIRGYGESRDAFGRVLASVTCEAVVQRSLEWVDQVDPVSTPLLSLKGSANKVFGRRFNILSFRWLSSNEV